MNFDHDTLLILVVTVNQAANTKLNTPPNFIENVGGDEIVSKKILTLHLLGSFCVYK